MNLLRKNFRIFLIFVLGITTIAWFYLNTPEPEKIENLVDVPSLTYTNALLTDQAIPIFSRGKVSASDIRHVTSEVPGLIIYKNEKLVRGAHIEQGELLIALDKQPFILDIAQKKSALDQAKLHLSETQAKARIAKRSAGRKSSEYARHVPQLQFAQSQVDAANAALNYASAQLDKAEVKAPISGKIIESHINQGEYLQSLSPIAKIYGTQKVEVRLPLNDHQIDILGLKNKSLVDHSITVNVHSFHDSNTIWQGIISRIEGERDSNQLLYVIASFDNTAVENSANAPLLPGSFVEASITGKTINNLLVLPRSLIQSGNQIWIINNENRLERKEINILYRGKKLVYTKGELSSDEKIVNTSFHQLISGLLVNPSSEASILDQRTVDTL